MGGGSKMRKINRRTKNIYRKKMNKRNDRKRKEIGEQKKMDLCF